MKILKIWQQITGKATQINLEPINKISLFVLILIDIFVLLNVFGGLNSIQNTVISPTESHFCINSWKDYRTSDQATKKYNFISSKINRSSASSSNYGTNYDDYRSNLIGDVNSTCKEYQTLSNDIRRNKELGEMSGEIRSLESQISNFERQNTNLKAEYDSTLLEKIAGQNESQSINTSTAEKTKFLIEDNTLKITNFQNQKETLQNDIVANSTANKLLSFLDNSDKFEALKSSFSSENFWYPILLFVLQILFLIPLIILALGTHLFAVKKNWGLLSVLSWNLFLIFCVPAVLRMFEFLQFGVLMNFALQFLGILVGSLAFLGSYLLILLIPFSGFLVILFFQKIVFNKKSQYKKRLSKKQCFHCGFKLNNQEIFCPNCGTNQTKSCANCGKLKYKNMPFCEHCGAADIL